MDMFGLESLDEEAVAIYQKSELINELESIRTRVATEGMTRDDAVLLERIAPGIFDGMNVNKFTMKPSSTKQTVAVEAIDWKRGAVVIAAAGAIITVITKIIGWLSSSLTSTGGGSGGIKDISETNAKIEKRCQDNVSSDVVTDENLKNAGKAVAKKIGKLSNTNTHYINLLVKRADEGKVVDSNGKPIAPNDVSNAVNKYVDAIKRTRASDRDSQLHALLGYMLLSKQGGVPLSLSMLDWKGGKKSDGVGQHHVLALEHTLELTNEVLDEIGKIASAVERIDNNKLVMMEDGKHVDGTVGEGVKLYGLMSKSNEVLRRLRNLLANNVSLNTVYSQSMLVDLTTASADSASLGRIIPEFNDSVKNVITDMREMSSTYISFWDMSDYQNYTNKVDFAKYTDLIVALADPRGREELAKLYGMVFDTTSKSSTPKFKGALDYSHEKLKVANTAVNKIQVKATRMDSAWLNLPFSVEGKSGFNAESTLNYVPVTQLKALADTAIALSRRMSELSSIINLGLRDADRAINMASKMK